MKGQKHMEQKAILSIFEQMKQHPLSPLIQFPCLTLHLRLLLSGNHHLSPMEMSHTIWCFGRSNQRTVICVTWITVIRVSAGSSDK
ncbi:hypothetical protein AB205_0011070 [Aquarana catesbeiana]|uniref:Uncharacterized protein n=1 Tax=Aquarana catesbeiana TaxID=8400 RepID=A0A2G9RWI2_AQUCT|nr:hypothetical protein AB205_0011070 [Aquarana catesbeiana]